MEIEISTVMQNDGIMKKAEAYTKELENVSIVPMMYIFFFLSFFFLSFFFG